MNMKGFHVLIKSYIHPAVLRFALIHADVGCCSSYWGGWVSRQRDDRAGPSTANRGGGGLQPLTTHETHTAHPADASWDFKYFPHAHANISAVASLCVYSCQTRPGTVLKAHTEAFFCVEQQQKNVFMNFDKNMRAVDVAVQSATADSAMHF